ncbi:hypothetical protein A7981_05935 [Methylovorus sp. MM2]|nr:hypothetical protein A7981_05935 [Methylovorus sp. MM2]
MGEKLAPHIAVIGGGCAGLAAAAKLAEHGLQVTLFESSPNLGGRARGVDWKGLRLDNGQHILLGAYQETLSLLKQAGVDIDQKLVRLPLKLRMHGEFELTAPSFLPAPLHILFGLLSATGLSWKDRFSALRIMTWMRLSGFKISQDMPLERYLIQHKQSPRLVRLLWEPLCLAALNTLVAQASTQVFLNVLRDSFTKVKSNSDMLLPKEDLSTLIAEPVANYIQNHRGNIRTATAISEITKDTQVKNNQGFIVKTEGGEEFHFSHVIVATSPFRAAPLFEKLTELNHAATLAKKLTYQPIYTVYLQYSEDAKLTMPMIGFAQGLSQWVFDRGLLYGQHGLLAVVISAEGDHQALTQEQLAVEIAEELSVAFPELGQPLWHKVIAEKRATFSCTYIIQRPAQKTALANLYLAGDYTEGDYPATIEGAVRSGVLCANHIIESIQQGTTP